MRNVDPGITLPDITLIGPPMAPPVELQRWLMALHGVPHRFEPRAAGLHALQQRRLNMPVELPLLLTPEGPVGGLRPSIAWLDARLQRAGGTLFPDAGDAAWVEALMTPLFPAGVKSFYAPMLEAPDVLGPKASSNVPMLDRLVVRMAFPLWRRLMRGGLKLDEFDADAARLTIDRVFAEVAAELGDRAFLHGTVPGIRDIVFAVMASPVILPAGHPADLPAVADLPGGFRALVQHCRAHPAGKLAQRVYGTRGAA